MQINQTNTSPSFGHAWARLRGSNRCIKLPFKPKDGSLPGHYFSKNCGDEVQFYISHPKNVRNKLEILLTNTHAKRYKEIKDEMDRKEYLNALICGYKGFLA